jgi:hypothetical protein
VSLFVLLVLDAAGFTSYKTLRKFWLDSFESSAVDLRAHRLACSQLMQCLAVQGAWQFLGAPATAALGGSDQLDQVGFLLAENVTGAMRSNSTLHPPIRLTFFTCDIVAGRALRHQVLDKARMRTP